jgi:rubredoxin
MNVCPDCRAGKEWIDYVQRETALIRMKVDYECQRCGYETTTVVKP